MEHHPPVCCIYLESKHFIWCCAPSRELHGLGNPILETGVVSLIITPNDSVGESGYPISMSLVSAWLKVPVPKEGLL